MIHRAALLTALLLVAPSTSNADSVPIMGRFNENATPAIIGPVEVRLGDRSLDACWTNLREVREYTEEKLRAHGFEVVETGADNFTLAIVVLANRGPAVFGQGPCRGVVNIQLGASFRRSLDGLRGNLSVVEYSGLVPEMGDFNEAVILHVGRFFEEYVQRVEFD